MGIFRFDLLAIFGYFTNIAVLKTILSFQFVFGFVCKRVLSKLQKSNLENRIVYSFQSGSICHNLYPARGRKHQIDHPINQDAIDLPQPLPRKGTETLIS